MFEIMAAKNFLKQGMYSSGAIGLFHKIKNRKNLTVVMFHRVLSISDPRWQGCDLEWSIPDAIFEQCIIFFKKFYNIISLEVLLSSYNKKGAVLPLCPLLITFDDGWADNEEYAFPILQKHKVPATIFLASRAIDQQSPFWEERLYAGWKTKRLHFELLNNLFEIFPPLNPKSEEGIRRFIDSLKKLPPEKKNRLLSELLDLLPFSPHTEMLTTSKVLALIKAGITIGSHGASHNPLPQVQDPKTEFSESIQCVQKFLKEAGDSDENICFSFPHGIYNDRIIEMAYQSGYQLLFTSDPYLIPLRKERLRTRLLGRISIPYRVVTDREGDFSAPMLAFWLVNRSSKQMRLK